MYTWKIYMECEGTKQKNKYVRIRNTFLVKRCEIYWHSQYAHDKHKTLFWWWCSAKANGYLYWYEIVVVSSLLKGLKNQTTFLRHKRLVRCLGKAKMTIIVEIWPGAGVALLDISIWNFYCRYINTFEKYRYR